MIVRARKHERRRIRERLRGDATTSVALASIIDRMLGL
jgi:hypothetical protein